jgi:hypothetical protein
LSLRFLMGGNVIAFPLASTIGFAFAGILKGAPQHMM